MLEQGKVYTFSGGQVKLANKRFTSIKNDYCLTLDYSTVVEPCGDDMHIKEDGFSFTELAKIEQILQNCTVDIIGILLEVGMTGSINLRDGGQRAKRTLLVGDESNLSISVTLWGDACEAQSYEVGQVIALKACRVSDYNGKSLNASSDLQDIAVGIKHPRALQLSKWYQSFAVNGKQPQVRSLTNGSEGGGRDDRVMLVSELEKFCAEDREVLEGKVVYCSLFAEVFWVFVQDSAEKRPIFYLACPDCKKKVIDDGRGYQCEACSKCHNEAKPTYNFSFKVQDCSGTLIINCLGEAGESILGIPANQVYEMGDNYEQQKALAQVAVGTPMKLTVRARIDQSGYSQDQDGNPKARINVVRAAKLESFQAANQDLLKHLSVYKSMM